MFGCEFQPTPHGEGWEELHSPAGAVLTQDGEALGLDTEVLHTAKAGEIPPQTTVSYQIYKRMSPTVLNSASSAGLLAEHEIPKWLNHECMIMTTTDGTFLVTHGDDDSPVWREVTTGQVYTISDSPTVSTYEILRATLTADPPLEVTWSVQSVGQRWTVSIETTDETPPEAAQSIAADLEMGALERHTPDTDDEVHILAVPTDQHEAAIADIREDEETYARAARLGATRVKISTGDDYLCVQYCSD